MKTYTITDGVQTFTTFEMYPHELPLANKLAAQYGLVWVRIEDFWT